MLEKPEKDPVLKEDNIPVWANSKGRKMSVEYIGLLEDLLIIRGSAAEVVIQRSKIGFIVSWSIVSSQSHWTRGQIDFLTEDLMQAFGLSDRCGEHGYGLLEEFGGTTAHQGFFLRFQKWLNIPGPGTGHNGDPNVSILIDDKIKFAVGKMIYGE